MVEVARLPQPQRNAGGLALVLEPPLYRSGGHVQPLTCWWQCVGEMSFNYIEYSINYFYNTLSTTLQL